MLRAVVRDAWPPSAGAQPGRVRVLIPPGGQVSATTTLQPERRGDRPAGLVTVRSFGPLGLAARQASLAAPWSVRVLPPFLSRRHLPEKLAQLRQLDGQHRSMIRGQGTEFDSLREYVLGDDVRSIDWRSTARLTDVMVRTWRPERDRRIIVVLDTGRTSAGRVAGVPRLDASMDAALLLAALASRAGDRVDLLAVDRQVRARVIGAGRGELLAALTSAMAVLDAELTEPDYGVMASAVLGVARAALPGGAADRPEPGRGGRGAAAQDRAAHFPVPGADRRGRRPAGERDGGGARRRRGGVRGRGRRAGPGRAGPASPLSSGAAAWTSWMPRRTGCRPRWPTPTCG